MSRENRIKENRIWVKNTIEKAFKADNLKSALNVLVDSLISNYPRSKIWVVETYGKRESFLAGSGNESYQSAKKISITDGYNLYLQNFPAKNEKKLEIIIAMFKIVINIFSN